MVEMTGGLLIRADNVEHVLRSVGAAPNGVVCMGTPDGRAAWLIDGKWDPTTVTGPTGSTMVVPAATPSGLGVESTVVEPDELVAGCESLAEVQALLLLVTSALAWSVGAAAPNLHYEFVGSHVDLAIATRDAIAAHDFRSPE